METAGWLALGLGVGTLLGAVLMARWTVGKGRDRKQKEMGRRREHPVERISREVCREAGLEIADIRPEYRQRIQLAILDALPNESAAEQAGREMIDSLRVARSNRWGE